MRELFSFVLCSYVFTTQSRAVIVDIDDLIIAADDIEGEKRDIIEYADLLMINHCDPDHPRLKFCKGAICNILYRRRQRDLATILSLYVKSIPKKTNSSDARDMAKRIVDIFGDSSYNLFTDERSKRVVVRVPKGEINVKEQVQPEGARV
jgi:hypothetical protein